MIIIYDFDGTLTPYSLPQYPIIKQCGYNDKDYLASVNKEMVKGADFYEAYWKCYRDILAKNGISATRDNVCMGAEDTKLNKGVIDYFKKFQTSKTGIKHYVVTSGIKDYVDKTPIREFVDGIYGVTFKQKNGEFQDVDFLLSDIKKVDVIKGIQKYNNGTNDIIYFGDGLTDSYAFEYVNSIGGQTVFITLNEKTNVTYQKLNTNGMIDKCFEAYFGENSKIDEYISQRLKIKSLENLASEER